MSLEDVECFTLAAADSAELAARAKAVVEGKSEAGVAAALAELGRSEGYDFTPEEMLEYKRTVLSAARLLTEDDLSQVAGGISTVYNGVHTTYVTNNTSTSVSLAAGELVPGAGGIIGAGVGSFVGTLAGGGSLSSATASGAFSAAGALNDMKEGINSAVSTVGGWFGL